MRNVMVDLETLGTVPGCAILSIGAVEFDIGGVSDNEFYATIYTPSCVDVFLTIDAKTQKWWEQQGKEARSILNICRNTDSSVPVRDALEHFGRWLNCGEGDVQVWGNGAAFDNAILAVAYEVCGAQLPWKFYNNRCYRTLKNFFPDIALERHGVYHNAIDDARCQAAHAVKLFQRLDECVGMWGDIQDEPVGEGIGEALQQASVDGPWGGQPKVDAPRDRVSRPPVPTGIRV